MARLSAKVCLLHALVSHHFGRRSDRDDPAGVKTHHAVRKTHHRLHDVLDHDDGDRLARKAHEQIKHLVDFRGGSPRTAPEEEDTEIASSEINSFGCVAMARASSILRNSPWLSFVVPPFA